MVIDLTAADAGPDSVFWHGRQVPGTFFSVRSYRREEASQKQPMVAPAGALLRVYVKVCAG